MKIKAIGRQIIVELSSDHINDAIKSTIIQLPEEVLAQSRGGSQFWTILDVGASAFDDEPPEVQNIDWVGRQVVTGRYPGHTIDYKPLDTDAELSQIRAISSDEVHGLIALEGEGGADV